MVGGCEEDRRPDLTIKPECYNICPFQVSRCDAPRDNSSYPHGRGAAAALVRGASHRAAGDLSRIAAERHTTGAARRT